MTKKEKATFSGIADILAESITGVVFCCLKGDSTDIEAAKEELGLAIESAMASITVGKDVTENDEPPATDFMITYYIETATENGVERSRIMSERVEAEDEDAAREEFNKKREGSVSLTVRAVIVSIFKL